MAFQGRGEEGDILQILNSRSDFSPLDLAGSGFVVGPAVAVDNTLPRYDGVTGKLIKASLVTVDNSDNVSTPGTVTASGFFGPRGEVTVLQVEEADGTPINLNTQRMIFPNASVLSSGSEVQIVFPTFSSGLITGPGSSTDNALVRWDGTAGVAIQNSNATLTDAGSMSLAEGLTAVGNVTTPQVIQPVSIVTSAYTEVTNVNSLVLASGSTTVVLPASPAVGQKHIIKDAAGGAGSSAISILGSGTTIDGLPSWSLVNNYEGIEVVYNGVEWNLI